jgi:hypothetical protein
MSTLAATLPRHSLFDELSRFVSALFASEAPAAAKSSAKDDLWKLYRMSAGMDSVNPELLAERIVLD